MAKASYLYLLLLMTLAALVLRADYVFYPQYDSKGGNIATLPGKTAKQLKAYCDAQPDCIAFNNMGEVKSSLLPTSQWNIWTDNAQKGLYRKVPDFNFTQGQDSEGGDLVSVPGLTVPQMKIYCAENPSCTGFNTKGDMKSDLAPQSQWTTWSSDPKQGLYTRDGSVPAESNPGSYDLYLNSYDEGAGNILDYMYGSRQKVKDEELRDHCTNDPTCVAYNSNGLFREQVITKDPYPTNARSVKMYVKTNPKSQVLKTPKLFPTTADITDDYVFYQGFQIGYEWTCGSGDYTDLKQKCAADPECAGFSGSRTILQKSQLPPITDWKFYTISCECGIYIKTKALPDIQFKSQSSSGYTFYQGLEAPGGSIMLLANHSIEEMKAFCDIDPRCDGFNTYGWIKTSLKPRSAWFKWTNVPGHGFYKRNTPGQIVGRPSGFPGYTLYTGYTAQVMVPFQQDASVTDCDASPECQGFSSSDGFLVRSFSPKSTWTHYTRDMSYGILIKDNVDAQLK